MDENTMRAICDATEQVVARIEPAHQQLATPCSEWSVHDLANHLLATLATRASAPVGRDRPPSRQVLARCQPSISSVMHLLGAYQTGAKALSGGHDCGRCRSHAHHAARRDALVQAWPGSPGSMCCIHGWDLARAIGTEVAIDPALAELDACVRPSSDRR